MCLSATPRSLRVAMISFCISTGPQI
jgi:hypothetical protein